MDKVFLSNTVSLQRIIDKNEADFIKMQNDERYLNFIGSETNINNIYYILFQSEIIGIVGADTEMFCDNVLSNPIIFFYENYSIKTTISLIQVINYFFESVRIDIMILNVYQNNIKMNNLMRKLNLSLVGAIKKIDGKDLNVFILTKNKFEQLKRDVLLNYGN